MAKRVLFVVTSHDALGETGHKTGSWLQELADPYYKLADHGVDVAFVSMIAGRTPIDPGSTAAPYLTETGTRFLNDRVAQGRLAEATAVGEVDAKAADGIFLVGGHGTMWDFARNPALARLIEAMEWQDKIVASVCHAIAGYLGVKKVDGSPFVAGRELTGFTDEEERMVQLDKVVPFLAESEIRGEGGVFSAGAPMTANVVVAGRLITGQNPMSAAGVGAEIRRQLS
jgi:putative intracellular protease/amidase